MYYLQLKQKYLYFKLEANKTYLLTHPQFVQKLVLFSLALHKIYLLILYDVPNLCTTNKR